MDLLYVAIRKSCEYIFVLSWIVHVASEKSFESGFGTTDATTLTLVGCLWVWACQLGFSLFISLFTSAAIYSLMLKFGRSALICKIGP